jgi:aspartate/methionine/tyrosine aminotransferase
LALKYNACNLGQGINNMGRFNTILIIKLPFSGFPNWNPPAFITKAAHDAHDEITTGIVLLVRDNLRTNLIMVVVPGGKLNQYARSAGHMRLVNAIAKMYSPLLGQELNGATDVCVSAGASEGT